MCSTITDSHSKLRKLHFQMVTVLFHTDAWELKQFVMKHFWITLYNISSKYIILVFIPYQYHKFYKFLLVPLLRYEYLFLLKLNHYGVPWSCAWQGISDICISFLRGGILSIILYYLDYYRHNVSIKYPLAIISSSLFGWYMMSVNYCVVLSQWYQFQGLNLKSLDDNNTFN